MEKQKGAVKWPFAVMVIGLAVSLLVFAYGILGKTNKDCELSRANEVKIAVHTEAIGSIKAQLNRIERKLDNYAKRNGDGSK